MYPSQVQVFGQLVDVKVFDDPIEVRPDNTQETIGYVMGQYDPQSTTISVTHIPDKPAIGMANFIHEIIECIDVCADLQLNHTQISTLACGIHQALLTGKVDFSQFSEYPVQ